jgi:hypothetical protein
MINFPLSLDTIDTLWGVRDNSHSTLVNAIPDANPLATIELADGSSFSDDRTTITIDNEIFICKKQAPGSNIFVVEERGAFDSSAAPHLATAIVRGHFVASNFLDLRDALLAVERYSSQYWKPTIVDDTLVTSPTSGVNDFDAFIVAGTGGAWSTANINDIAVWTGMEWQFITPDNKSVANVVGKGIMAFDGSSWVDQTAGSVTVHSDVTDAGSGQIITAAERTLLGSALQTETVTNLQIIGNTLRYTNEAGTDQDVDLSLYLDDTNLSRLVSGTVDSNTGIATFTRDDATTFTVDMSDLLDNQTAAELPTDNSGNSLTGTDQQATNTEIANRLDVTEAATTLNTAKVSADGSVTTHNDVTDAGSGQIITAAERALLGSALQTETVTNLQIMGNTLRYTNEAGTDQDIDLSLYLDDSNLARLVSGTLDGGTGIATFTRDDASTFTVDFSSLLDNQDASEIPTDNSGNSLTATDQQATNDEIANRLDVNDAATALNTAKVSADGSVTTHNDVTDAGSGQIITAAERALLGSALQSETVTNLQILGNTLRYTNENGVDQDIDLSLYLDDTNLARLVSGTLDGGTGIATFTRDDASTFTIDLSSLLDNQTAAEVPTDNSGNSLTATDQQATNDEIAGRLDATEAATALNTAKVSADGSVTTHNDVTDAGSGQIITAAERALLGSALQSETVTNLQIIGNTLRYTNENGVDQDIDLSLYLDDTNLARLVSGTLNGTTGIATFTRDDASTFTVDMSALLDNQTSAEVPTDNSGNSLTATDQQATNDEIAGRLDATETATALNTAKVSADGSVTTHNDVTSAGSGQIITAAERALLGSALQSETVTNLQILGNTLRYTNENGVDQDIDLSLYLDDTNLSRIVSGTLDSGTGIATFNRDDASTFTIDFSALLDNQNSSEVPTDNSGNSLTATNQQATNDEIASRLDATEAATALNTAKVSADGSVTTHNDVTSAGSGEIITAAERTSYNNRLSFYEVYEAGTTALAGTPVIVDYDTERLVNGDFALAGGQVTVSFTGSLKVSYSNTADVTNNSVGS